MKQLIDTVVFIPKSHCHIFYFIYFDSTLVKLQAVFLFCRKMKQTKARWERKLSNLSTEIQRQSWSLVSWLLDLKESATNKLAVCVWPGTAEQWQVMLKTVSPLNYRKCPFAVLFTRASCTMLKEEKCLSNNPHPIQMINNPGIIEI